jgi:hypothetical protein
MTFHGDKHHNFKHVNKHSQHDHLNRINFIDEPKFICSNRERVGDNEYVCLGHGKGDHLFPTFHGDPEREFKFWVYPDSKKLVTPRWDFRVSDVCNHHQFVENKEDGIKEYRCMGHSQTFHGDPNREHHFWLTDSHAQNLNKWDFDTFNAHDVCSHHRRVDGNTY